MTERFYRVERKDGLQRMSGVFSLEGYYGKVGKLWTTLNRLRNHYRQCVKGTNFTVRRDGTYERISPTLPASLPKSDVVIEYELREVRRFPARGLFSQTQ